MAGMLCYGLEANTLTTAIKSACEAFIRPNKSVSSVFFSLTL